MDSLDQVMRDAEDFSGVDTWHSEREAREAAIQARRFGTSSSNIIKLRNTMRAPPPPAFTQGLAPRAPPTRAPPRSNPPSPPATPPPSPPADPAPVLAAYEAALAAAVAVRKATLFHKATIPSPSPPTSP